MNAPTINPKAFWKLPHEIKQKWLEALCSGEYRQGQGWLHDASADKYCCLGVLCVVMGEEKESLVLCPLPMNINASNASIEKYRFGQRYQWEIPYKGSVTTLTNLNDNEAISFTEIADIIEECVETY